MGINNISALIDGSVADSHDETDVSTALERSTQDGSGFAGDLSRVEEMLPPSDFEEVPE
jgi:hypothetical protein